MRRAVLAGSRRTPLLAGGVGTAAATSVRHATTIPLAPGLHSGGSSERKKVRIFNRDAKLAQRDRFAQVPVEECKLHQHISEIMMERLSFVQRDFETVLELGCGKGLLSQAFLKSNPRGLKKYIQCDSSQAMLDSCFDATCEALPEEVELEQHCVDEEGIIPFERRSADLVIAMLSMHWVNDIEATLKHIRTVLKKDGVVFICVFGGRTLAELQSCFTVAEQERDGGVSPHVSPFLTGPTMSDLLANSGYNFPTVDVDRFTFYWESAFHLMEYLQMIGESNCLYGRRDFISKDVLTATAAVYDRLWMEEQGVPSTFEIVHGVGWSPHPSHADPSPRGSGQSLSLKDIAESLGEKVMTEEEEQGPLSKEAKGAILEDLLQAKGMNKDRLAKLKELMETRLAGNDSVKIEEEIHKLRKQMQDNLQSDAADRVTASIPRSEFSEKKVEKIPFQRTISREHGTADEDYKTFVNTLKVSGSNESLRAKEKPPGDEK